MTEVVTGVWWDEGWKHYGWTCPRCHHSGINHQSPESARFSFAAHHCPRHPDRLHVVESLANGAMGASLAKTPVGSNE